jgi:hypothetical protein
MLGVAIAFLLVRLAGRQEDEAVVFLKDGFQLRRTPRLRALTFQADL